MQLTTLKTALRNLRKHKSFVVVNTLGLAVAIASSIVILLYARNELSYDRFHSNADQLHLVVKERSTAQGVVELRDTWVPLLAAMRSRYSEIVDGARYFESDAWVEANGQKLQAQAAYADPAFLTMFSFPLAQGNPATALDGVNSAVLSAEMATRLFGSADPIGQRLTLDFEQDYLISGVLEEYPGNSSLRPDILVPFESVIPPDDEMNSNWGSSFLFTYLQLESADRAIDLETAFPEMVRTLFGEEGPNGAENMNLRLWSLPSLRDRAEGTTATAYALLIIALAIILIACVNFMNLTTARSMERAREVGVRKTLGAQRSHLVWQFLGESMSVSFIALLAGIYLTELLLPAFNALYDLDLRFDLLGDSLLAALLVAIGLGAGVLSGAYPAVVLSGFRTVESLRGKLKSSRHGIWVRNSLSVFQFSMAIILIIGVTVIWQQVQYMKNADLNFNPENVVVIPSALGDFADREVAVTRMDAFKNSILQIPGVERVSASMSVPGAYQNSNVFAVPEDWQQPEPLRMLIAGADDEYFATYGMQFIEGRDFNRELANERESIILNETAMRDMGWSSAIGKRVSDRWTVVGVVEDFHYQSLQNDVRAIIHAFAPQDSGNNQYISVRLQGSANPAEILPRLEALWQELDPSRPFNYFFAEESFDELYRDVDNFSTIIGYFSMLAIFIANLGLLGLAAFSVVQRTREIGIRRILGASVSSILTLLSRQFTMPVLIANLIAWPIAWFAVSNWLQGFAYRVELSPLVFLFAGALALSLAIVTISIQAARAASANPVEALRYE
jgi:putative ABC transport system permease protein